MSHLLALALHFCFEHFFKGLFPHAHLKADVLKVSMEVIQHSATVKYERWFQHLLVDLFIIQFLWK